MINFIDRQVLSVFVGPIKEEFGVSDKAMGMLVGFALLTISSVNVSGAICFILPGRCMEQGLRRAND